MHTAEAVFEHFACTDACTGWAELTGLPRRSEDAVCNAIHLMRQKAPFPLLSIDSDNSSEFINDFIIRYCMSEKTAFTRSRLYKKNNQAHVEQKNWKIGLWFAVPLAMTVGKRIKNLPSSKAFMMITALHQFLSTIFQIYCRRTHWQ